MSKVHGRIFILFVTPYSISLIIFTLDLVKSKTDILLIF